MEKIYLSNKISNWISLNCGPNGFLIFKNGIETSFLQIFNNTDEIISYRNW